MAASNKSRASLEFGQRGMYFDVHTHLWELTIDPDPKEVEDCLRLAARAGIGKHVQLGNLHLAGGNWVQPDPEGTMKVNSHTLKAMKLHPDKFIGFCYLNPGSPASFIQEEITRCVVEGGMKGLKFEAAQKATDRRYDAICERAQALDITILHHTWYNMLGFTWPTESSPAEAADLARRFPKVSFIFAHLGGGRERGVHDLIDLPNVCYDTSGSYPESELVEYAARHLGAERIIFGSDWPGRNFSVQAARILGAKLTEREKQLAMGGNLARLLKLTPKDSKGAAA